jgi:signal transduction histidine kinase
VLSHEINNSLTPIKSIAHSIRRMIARAPDMKRGAEIQEALSLIETRSGALGRFLRAYAQLARLPKPQLRPVQIAPLVRRVAELEDRATVAVRADGDAWVSADPDQLEQLLINVVRNGVDAALPGGGSVAIGWTLGDGVVDVHVDDEGPGLPDTANLFVPFFTTKPTGSGIGLALSRQIAEAHGGTLTLANRTPQPGCRATLRLAIQQALAQ